MTPLTLNWTNWTHWTREDLTYFFTITTPTQETCSLNLIICGFKVSTKRSFFVRIVLGKLKPPPHPVTMEFVKVSIGAPGAREVGSYISGSCCVAGCVWEVRFKACFFRKWGNEPNWDLAIQNDWPQKNWWLEVAKHHPKYMVTKLVNNVLLEPNGEIHPQFFQRTSVHDQKRLLKKHRWKKAPFREWCIAKPPLFPKWHFHLAKPVKMTPFSNFKTTPLLGPPRHQLGINAAMVQLCPSGHQFSGAIQGSTKRRQRSKCLGSRSPAKSHRGCLGCLNHQLIHQLMYISGF